MSFVDIFGSSHAIGPFQECGRAVLVFFYGLMLVRFAGRRIFGKWSALDIVVSIIVGSNLTRAVTGNAPLLGTLAATTLLIMLHWVLSHLAARSTALSNLIEGRAVGLGRAGALNAEVQKHHAVTDADLNEALRQAGIDRVEESRKLTLEPSGKISVLADQ